MERNVFNMTSFTLKLIAIITMFIDHFGYAIMGQFSFFNLFGRLAFPIFAFQISEGFIHTKSVKKYFFRLIIFALISQIPFSLFTYYIVHANPYTLNVFFTLIFGLTSIYLYDLITKLFDKIYNDRINNNNESAIENTSKLQVQKSDTQKSNIPKSNSCFSNFTFVKLFGVVFGIIIACTLAYCADFLNTDYGFWGVIVVFAFYVFKKNKVTSTIIFFLLCIAKYLIPFIQSGFNYLYILLCLSTFASICFINSYNGKQGKKIKYLLYIFYPLHLLLLYFFFRG